LVCRLMGSMSCGVVAQVSVLAILWWSAAVVVGLKVKSVLSTVNEQPALFPYPFLFTSMLNLGVCCWSLLGAQAFRLARAGINRDPAKLLPKEAGFLLLMGCLQGLELALANKSYQYLSVSMNRMVMACTVVFQLFTAVLWKLERIWWLKWIAALMLVGGALVQGLDCTHALGVVGVVCGPHSSTLAAHAPGPVEDSWQGWVLVVSSVLISANRWAFTQHVFQRSPKQSALRRLEKVQMMPYMSTGTVVACLAFAAAFEPNAFAAIAGKGVWQHIVQPVLVVSSCVALLTMCELVIVSITAATVMVILAVVHNIPMILAGVIFDNDVVFRNQWVGFAFCSIGAGMYFYARSLDTPIGGGGSKAALLDGEE